MQNSVTELPFNRFLGLEAVAESSHTLRLPSGSQYLNHLGTVHAGALLSLAEASSGEFLLRLGPVEGIVPVVRRLESKFRKPANGAVTATASATPEALQQLDTDLSSKSRTLFTISVELHDESGAHVMSASVEWFIQRLAASEQTSEQNG